MGDLSTHFSRAEFACHCGCGFNRPNQELINKLEEMRRMAGKPIKVISGCRCRAHNRAIGGAVKSQHTLGNAADIIIDGMTPDEVAIVASNVLYARGGIGVYRTFTHIDVRPGGMARWRG